MKKTIVFIVLSFLTVIFTLIVYYEDIKIKKEQELAIAEKNVDVLKMNLLQHITAIEQKLPDSLAVYDAKKQLTPLSQITSNGPRIGLYMDVNQCMSCWQSELKYLETLRSQTKNMDPPFVLAGGYNIREFTLLSNQYKASFPIYALRHQNDMGYLRKYNTPFFFVLEPNGKISSVLFVFSTMPYFMRKPYFENLIKMCRIEKTIKQNTTKLTNNDLELLNDTVDLGEVRMRKKYEAIFKVKNNRDKACNIYDVQPLCNCIMPKSYPSTILPNEIEEFHINFLSSTKGKFTRSVVFRTDKGNKNYHLTVKGEVV